MSYFRTLLATLFLHALCAAQPALPDNFVGRPEFINDRWSFEAEMKALSEIDGGINQCELLHECVVVRKTRGLAYCLFENQELVLNGTSGSP